MPSSSLVIISGQIEEQGSDSFTKFYMYSSLLHAICVRDPSKGFFDLMPAKVNVLFGTSTGFDLEKFDGAFETQVNQYRGMFSPAQPAPLVVVEKIVMTYLRKSQVADLVFIIDKMLDHLSDPNFKPTKKNSQSIYNDSGFESHRTVIKNFLNQTAAVNHLALTLMDNSIDCAIAAGVVLTGLVVILSSLFSLVGFLIGATLLVGGAYEINRDLSKIRVGEDQIKKAVDLQQESGLAVYNNKSIMDKTIYSKNYKKYFLQGIIKPIFYTPVTMLEQIVIEPAAVNQAKNLRQCGNSIFGC